ncbi:MAG TPA: 30S ribosomal protein S8 [Thermoanaerobaculia bacterium]|nr:30S ribosomal protein S8 [Thermoanaerobaculia bacterium]HUM30652.1 30S ribosomal protein S8 [Thermoanaerobaculia bacterium]HXK68940.1 30S ribosomal protein S8 [Thermoanaerobaculia bacterium]
MSQTDPIADFLTMIRNAHMASHGELSVPSSNIKMNIAKILKEEGYIRNYKFVEQDKRQLLNITLKYDEEGKPVIRHLQRVSKPGRRVYRGANDIPVILNGMGLCIISTSRGVLSDRKAREMGVGGELLCEVW